MAHSLSQRTRLGLLVLDVAVLLSASRVGFGTYWPTNDERGFWFFTALLGLLLGSRLDTPFFVTPADVLLYAAPAATALLLIDSWASWTPETRAAFAVALGFCLLCVLLGSSAILTNGSRNERIQRTSDAMRVLVETVGKPKIVYSVVVGFAVFAFHRQSTIEFSAIVSAWVLTAVLSPAEGVIHLARRLRRIFRPGSAYGQDGEVVAFQTPGLLLIRQARARTIAPRALVGVRDAVGAAKLAMALDQVGRDDGVLIRALELAVPDKSIPRLVDDVTGLPPDGVVCIAPHTYGAYGSEGFMPDAARLVGVVAPDTSIERLYFEVVVDDELEEGRLVEVQVRGRPVLYQIINGLTKEDVIRQRNTHGYARAQAQKIGIWDQQSKRFVLARWLPRPNAPVLLRSTSNAILSPEAIGHLPGTDYAVQLKNVSSLVTHNTAILGILGVGKSSLAFELVERVITANIKVICIDITSQYETELAFFLDPEKQKKIEELLQATTVNGKVNFQQNVEEGGSRAKFAAKLGELVSAFLAAKNTSPLLVINPSRFDVWRQDSKMYDKRASMASVSAAEITQMISESALDAVAKLGMTDSARLCVVYEEAHALVPEWNSAIADGDRSAANGTARAILQGRKYGMGCILITQRTANVSKTILNQCNTVFAMRTFDDTGKGFLANYIGDEYANMLPSLSERHAVLFGRASSCENPVFVRLNDRADFLSTFRQPAASSSSDASVESPPVR